MLLVKTNQELVIEAALTLEILAWPGPGRTGSAEVLTSINYVLVRTAARILLKQSILFSLGIMSVPGTHDWGWLVSN